MLEPHTNLKQREVSHPSKQDGLADVLDRVLDKGLVIAGDVTISLVDTELLTLKVRLLLASADKAREMGIDWWEHDPSLCSAARKQQEDTEQLAQENRTLHERLEQMESKLATLTAEQSGKRSDAEQES